MTTTTTTNFRSAFSLLFLAQVLSKLLPFLFNSVFVYRTISSADGVGDTLVLFPLVYAFVLSIRDGLRRSLLRRTREEGDSEEDDENEHVFRVAKRYVKRYVVFVLVLLVVPLLLLLLFWSSSKAEKAEKAASFSSSLSSSSAYRISLVSCVCAALIELTSEPHYIWLQKKQLFGSRVMAETVGTFARTAVLFYHLSSHIDSTILSKEKRKTNVLFAFAFAQVGQSCATSAVYAASYYLYRKRDDDVRKKQKKRRKGTKTTTDGKKERSDDDEKKQRLLIDSFLYQSYLKLALAEGEKFALIIANSEDTVMGVFGLVSNLGSLFVRLVLQPFEEIAFVTFAASATKDKKKEKLGDILSIGVLVGTIAFFVGPFFAKDVMYFLYGKKWMEDGTETLQAYARLILPLSINGIVEGFAHAVMNEREIKKHGNAWLVSCSFVNCALGFSLLKCSRIGAAGLVYGNFISLMLRIYLTSRFLIRTGKLSSTIFRETLPKPGTLVAVAACTFALTAIEEDTNGRKTAEMTPNFKHTVVTGGSVAVALLIALFVWEQDRFRKVFSTNSFKRKRN